ncbi:MAG: GTPase HflX, partial [Spirochaetaceae bacterium]|nr:GTPase HflX [Spirochaetaceae bacterium]
MAQQLYDTAPAAVRAFLVGLWDEKIEKAQAESLTAELEGLVQSLGHKAVGVEIVRLRDDASHRGTFGIGTGKVDEITEKCAAANADCLILDWDLSPSQQRNWENRAGISVFDRRELIIQIFGSRARTREAGLQVELARLKFSLPRLTHKYIDLARQRGGSYGAKGAGETKFETDRRVVENRIHHIE